MLKKKTHILSCITLTLFVLLFSVGVGFGQDTVTVPDVMGLNVPQAVAELNAVGLRFGGQTASPTTADTSIAPGHVTSQSIEAGIQVEFGASIDLSVLSDTRVRLVYDDNDLTMINEAGVTINLNGLIFTSDSGAQRFNAISWQGNLENGDCTQIWTINRREPKRVSGCDSIFWLTTNNPAEYFWTQTAGLNEFTIAQNGQTLATCPAAPANSQDNPSSCIFYVVASEMTSQTTEFIYFTYTQETFAVINTTPDAWMPLTDTPIYNFNPQSSNPGNSLRLSDSQMIPNPDIIGDVQRLAPEQCIVFSILENPDLPEPCDVIIHQTVDLSLAFWQADFELESPFTTEGRSSCPAASDNLTRCIMPR